MIDCSKMEKGFYFVKTDGAWTIMAFENDEFYDTISGDYASCDHKDFIEEIGDKIELPE